ncbi:spermidine synthase [bacterium]|nr:spermidine synthase [bacterium]
MSMPHHGNERRVSPGMESAREGVPFFSHPGVRLFATSAAILFLELLLIRWIPANVTYVGFFSNFLLMGAFLGIGVGTLLGRSGVAPPVSPFGPLLLVTVLLVSKAQLNVQLRSQDEVFFGLAESNAADANFLVLPLLVGITSVLLASLALPLGPLLRAMPPLRAYATDIAGALFGIAAFSALSFSWAPPIAWFSVLAGLAAAIALGRRIRPASLVGAASFAAVLALLATDERLARDSWSPYYRISLVREENARRAHIFVNGIPHQSMWPVSELPEREPFRFQVYRWFRGRTFDRVLVIGAGSGTDVAVALALGAKHVDAVEIDPRIAEIGKAINPNRPYQSERVELFLDDGRSFLRRTDRVYDLVIFALPDSLTLVSSTANLRLESFLFTDESFASVRRHLAPGGVCVLYNYYRQEWLIDRLASMLGRGCGSAPLVRRFFPVSASIAAGPGVAALTTLPDEVDPPRTESAPAPALDDWPFLYLKERSLPIHYLVALGLVLAFAVFLVTGACRVTKTPLTRASPHFFALGAAFLLLETRSLVTFSLLFGNTWLVNSLVFFGILASVLAAIAVNAKLELKRPALLYGGLFLALAVNLLLPPESLLLDPAWLRYALASLLAFAPVFFANLVFTRSFRDTKTADMAFASNLLGAVLGGALEYLSLLTGFRALVLVVAGLYALAMLLATRWRSLGDAELT